METLVYQDPNANPIGVAVDASGNVYAGARGIEAMVKIPWNGTSYGSPETVVGSLNGTTGVAVDGAGNGYVESTDSQQIFKVPWNGTSYGPPEEIGGNWNYTIGLATDGYGNVYTAETFGERIQKIPWNGAGYDAQTILHNFDDGCFASSSTLDSSRNIYVACNNTGTVQKLPWNGVNYGTPVPINTSPLSAPQGIAMDSLGSVYVADTNNHRVLKESFSTPPTLSFSPPPVAIGDAAPFQNVTVHNLGNAPLLIDNLFPSPNFYADLGQCASAQGSGGLAANSTCQLNLTSKPLQVGPQTGTATLNDNHLNVRNSTQVIQISGTEVANTETTLALLSTNPAAINTPVNVHALVTIPGADPLRRSRAYRSSFWITALRQVLS